MGHRTATEKYCSFCRLPTSNFSTTSSFGRSVLLLAPATSTSAATAVVVLSRFLTVMSDVVFAAAGWAWARSHHLITSRAEREHDGLPTEEDKLDEAEPASGHTPSGG